jgi:hypothetical protein
MSGLATLWSERISIPLPKKDQLVIARIGGKCSSSRQPPLCVSLRNSEFTAGDDLFERFDTLFKFRQGCRHLFYAPNGVDFISLVRGMAQRFFITDFPSWYLVLNESTVLAIAQVRFHRRNSYLAAVLHYLILEGSASVP